MNKSEVFDDRLAELEKVIMDYYLAKGFKIGKNKSNFKIVMTTDYKDKNLKVFFHTGEQPYKLDFEITSERTIEMFDKTFEFFRLDN